MIKATIIFLLVGALTHRASAQTGGIGEPAFAFSLATVHGDTVRLQDLAGKTLIVDIWYTGCSGCAKFYQHKLAVLESQLADRNDVVFLSISLDKDKTVWKKSVAGGEYTSGHAINVNSGSIGSKHPIIPFYNITRVPSMLVIDKKGYTADVLYRPYKLSLQQLTSRISASL